MSAALVSSVLDATEYHQNNFLSSSNNPCRTQSILDQRRQTISSITFSQARHRNFSGPIVGTASLTHMTGSTSGRSGLDNRTLATPPPGVPGASISCSKDVMSNGYPQVRDSSPNHFYQQMAFTSGINNANNNRESSGSGGGITSNHREHRKVDRSYSDSEHDRINGNSGRSVNSSRYKTELCRPFEENGHCKYGDKCQFAHGAHELRNLARHPKYKTERCRTYHTIGFCPYGPRCHFIHNDEERAASKSSQQQRIVSNNFSSSLGANQRPNSIKLSGLSSLGSSFESVSSQSSSSSSTGHLSPTFLDDLVPSISTFSPASSSTSSTHSQDSGSPRSSPVACNFPASDAAGVSSLLTPLNIQTQQFNCNVIDLAALQFSTLLNFNQNQRNNCDTSTTVLNLSTSGNRAAATTRSDDITGCDVWASSLCTEIPHPPASPVSLSDESMGSTGSIASECGVVQDTTVHFPLDLGKSFRLPIFNKLSHD